MSSGIRTDLALESRELNPDIEGVEEQTEERERMTVSRIKITDGTAAEKLDKPSANTSRWTRPSSVTARSTFLSR